MKIKMKKGNKLVAQLSFWLWTVVLWAFTFVANAISLSTYQQDNNRIVLTRDDNSTVVLQALGHNSIDVEYIVPGELPFPAVAVDTEILEQATALNLNVKESEQALMIQSSGLSVRVNKTPFGLSFYRNGEKVVEEAAGGFYMNTLRGAQFKLTDDEKIYGGGQRVLGMDRRGQRMPLYNRASYGYTNEPVNQMYYGLPAIMSSKNYAILFDNTASGNLDIGSDNPDILQFDAVGGRVAYIVSVANSLPDLVKQVVTITGKQPLPPRWALGNFASRFGYHTEQETRDMVQKFNDDGIPLDAVVLDLYWFGPDIQGHMGNLSWDRNAFPTPEKMMADFSEQNINTVVITEPFILSTSSQFESAENANALATRKGAGTRTFDFYFGNTGLVDVFNDKGRNWFWQYYEKLSKQGVSGWWGDLGEPEVHPYDAIHNWDGREVTGDEIHNAYGHRWAQMVYEGSLQLQPEKRPLVLMRAGYLGSQRYGMVPWTGDVSRSWGGFKPQIELALQMSVFGLAYTHSDLGGFAGGESFDSELYIRWLQAGTFAPVYRPHAQENIAPEPVFHDEKTKATVKQYIQLRYDLLPYNYSLAFENSLTGMPLMRPLSFLDSERFFEHDDSYLWGENILVQPVTEQGATKVDIALPQGVWFDFFGDTRYEGGKTIAYDAPVEKLPVLVKAGAFVPMQPGLQRTAHANSESLTMHYWADDSVEQSNYRLYEDNGQSPNSIDKGEYATSLFEAQNTSNGLVLTVNTQGNFSDMSEQRATQWIIHGFQQVPKTVEGAIEWKWEESTHRLLIKSTIERTEEARITIQK